MRVLAHANTGTADVNLARFGFRRKTIEAPSTNLQAPEKLQTSSSNQRKHKRSIQRELLFAEPPAGWLKSGLVIGAWMFSGAWCLELGALASQNSIENSEESGSPPRNLIFTSGVQIGRASCRE